MFARENMPIFSATKLDNLGVMVELIQNTCLYFLFFFGQMFEAINGRLLAFKGKKLLICWYNLSVWTKKRTRKLDRGQVPLN